MHRATAASVSVAVRRVDVRSSIDRAWRALSPIRRVSNRVPIATYRSVVAVDYEAELDQFRLLKFC